MLDQRRTQCVQLAEQGRGLGGRQHLALYPIVTSQHNFAQLP
jgi:hypothetical protein